MKSVNAGLRYGRVCIGRSVTGEDREGLRIFVVGRGVKWLLVGEL